MEKSEKALQLAEVKGHLNHRVAIVAIGAVAGVIASHLSDRAYVTAVMKWREHRSASTEE